MTRSPSLQVEYQEALNSCLIIRILALVQVEAMSTFSLHPMPQHSVLGYLGCKAVAEVEVLKMRQA